MGWQPWWCQARLVWLLGGAAHATQTLGLLWHAADASHHCTLLTLPTVRCRGEHGWFRLAMGQGNDLGVEQSCDWAVPAPVDF